MFSSWFFMLDLFPTFFGNIEKCPFTYWLNGRWFLQMVDRDFQHEVNWKVVSPDSREDSGNLYPIYHPFPCSDFWSQAWGVVLASEPVGGRSRATELPCFIRKSYTTHTLFSYAILWYRYQYASCIVHLHQSMSAYNQRTQPMSNVPLAYSAYA